MTGDKIQTACVHQGQRCWPCMTDGCYGEPTRHVWFDSDDIEAAVAKGHPAPSGLCGCAFCGWPALGLSGPLDGGPVETYTLTWNNDPDRTYVLSVEDAARVVAGWQGRGVLTGDLAAGHVTFKHGAMRAELNRGEGQ